MPIVGRREMRLPESGQGWAELFVDAAVPATAAEALAGVTRSRCSMPSRLPLSVLSCAALPPQLPVNVRQGPTMAMDRACSLDAFVAESKIA